MRSEYKFILHRVCLPLKSEKNSTILDTLKKEIEGSSENKKLQEFVQKMNKGELKNIYYEQGKDSLSENLIKEIESYRPSLCMEFKIESEKVNYYGNLLTNSDISFNI